MEALILSCGTGGGHNSVGMAICKELRARGHHADFLDPYTLRSKRLADGVANTYIHVVQRTPRLFGVIYRLGELVRRVPFPSPVYYANIKAARRLAKYLKQHPYDVILTPHLFPAEMLTYLKRKKALSAPTVFVATDYACIPFTEETRCDYYVIPSAALSEEFSSRGIPANKLLPFGIPVSKSFYEAADSTDAKQKLGLSCDLTYLLLVGGSIGAGKLVQTLKCLKRYYRNRSDVRLIVICSANKKVYRKLRQLADDRVLLLRHTDQMALYMRACAIVLSKAGGASSTEAATLRVPLIHIPSIPGCESRNQAFFVRRQMSLAVRGTDRSLIAALRRLESPAAADQMKKAQAAALPPHALTRLCDWLEQL